MDQLLVIVISGLTTALGIGVASVTLYITFMLLQKIMLPAKEK